MSHSYEGFEDMYFEVGGKRLKKGRYFGAWRNDKKHGHGTVIFSDGTLYVGAFKNDKITGQGTAVFVNGDKYSGTWRNGKKHGLITLTYPNGERDV